MMRSRALRRMRARNNLCGGGTISYRGYLRWLTTCPDVSPWLASKAAEVMARKGMRS